MGHENGALMTIVSGMTTLKHEKLMIAAFTTWLYRKTPDLCLF